MQTLHILSHTDAGRAIEAIQQELNRRDKAAVIAVADSHGELIALLRMDGAPLPSVLIASNKAWTAARERKPSKELGQAARDPVDGFDMAYYGDTRYIGWGGGVPVRVNGEVVGAIGVSGLPEAEDMELVEIGIAAILSQISS
ncbi:MAG TPA: heme-binding protein [Anaerolineales bacterium]|nr:heme-binding protein [Anaerolineales bacterium]